MKETEIRDGMVFEAIGANRELRGAREIVVTTVYPGKLQATVSNMRTGGGWRMSLLTLTNPKRWQYTGVNAWEPATTRSSLDTLPPPEKPSGNVRKHQIQDGAR